jgi:hypothetical protein
MSKHLRRPAIWIAIALSIIPLISLILFVNRYGNSAYPYSDGFTVSALTAIHVTSGTFSLPDLFAWHNGHQVVFSRLITIFSTLTMGWSPAFEVWINVFIGVFNIGLLIAFAARVMPPHAHWIATPTSVLMLSTDMGMTWLVGIFSQWHLTLFFAMLALLALLYSRRDWIAVVLACVAAACASLSSANGLIAWGMVVLLMLIHERYRSPLLYLLPLVGGAAFVGWYAVGLSGGNAVGLPPPLAFLDFNLIYLGRPLVHREHLVFARYIALFGIIIFAINLWLYWRITKTFRPVALWLPIMAYGVVSGVLYTISRYESFGGTFAATVERYLHTSSVVWVGFFAVVITTAAAGMQQLSGTRRISLIAVNVIGAGVIVGSYAVNLQFGVFRMDYDFRVWQIQEAGQCMERYPLERDATCAGDTHINMPMVDLLAAWRLGGFSDRSPELALPYALPGDKVILNLDDAWGQVHLRDWWLDGIAHDDILHIAPLADAAIEAQIAEIDRPLSTRLTDTNTDSLNTLDRFLSDAPAYWLIIHPDREITGFSNRIMDTGYPVSTTDLPYGYTTRRYLGQPPDDAEQLTFDQWLHIDGWRVVDAEDAAACDTITVQSWWRRSDAPPNVETRMTLALVPSDWSRGIANVDAPPGIVPIMEWEPGALYGDERRITLPCDLPPGDYLLAVRSLHLRYRVANVFS